MTRLTTTTTTPLAVSADYADALLVARRAKKLLFLLLMLGLLAQIAIFLCAKFNVIKIGAGDTATVAMPRRVEVTSFHKADHGTEISTDGHEGLDSNHRTCAGLRPGEKCTSGRSEGGAGSTTA